MLNSDVSRVGVLGGTFDPPHFGHLAAALEAKHFLGLHTVLFVVANDPWQKSPFAQVTPARLRLKMVSEAVREMAGLQTSAVEIDRGGESYMADTLEELSSRLPGAELFMIIGSDAAAGLDTWKRPAELRRLASLVVIERAGCRGDGPPSGWPATVVQCPSLDISSSDIRARIAQGRPVEALLPQAVADFVRQHGLYGDAQ